MSTRVAVVIEWDILDEGDFRTFPYASFCLNSSIFSVWVIDEDANLAWIYFQTGCGVSSSVEVGNAVNKSIGGVVVAATVKSFPTSVVGE